MIGNTDNEKGDRMTFDSKRYWISRYQKGGTSGKGSYGRMAEYKAGVINDLVREADIIPLLNSVAATGIR